MGIIGKQAIRGSIYAYIGAGLGFITVALIWPKVLSESQVGLLKLVVSVAVIFAQFGSLGFANVITKYFTFYRERDSAHRGFLQLIIGVIIAGSILSIVSFLILKPYFLKRDIHSVELLSDFYLYIIPLILFTIIFELFDNYSKVLYDAILGTAIREIVPRVLNLFLVVAYYYSWVSFQVFVPLYVLALSLPSVLIVCILVWRKQLSLGTFTISRAEFKPMIPLALYSLVGGFGAIAVFNIDTIMVNKMLGLKFTGIYSIAFTFGSLLMVPTRALGKISSVIISDAFKNNDLKTIEIVYRKSCLNQLIIGCILFLLLWINIDDVFSFLPEAYEKGKYVVFFIAVANLFELATGVNGAIISISDYYRYQWYFVFILLVLVILTNLLLIPIWGITGAAIASLISVFTYNLARYLFLYFKFKMQPFDGRTLSVIVILITLFVIFQLAPYIINLNPIFSIAIKSLICSILFAVPFILFRLSDEFNWQNVKQYSQVQINKYLKRKL